MTAANEVVFLLDVDNKLRIRAAMKKVWGDHLTTIFPRHGHYALDPRNIAAYSLADITIEHIADLINYDFSTLLGIPKAGCAQQEACLLYTSDAADDLTRVDLGGRRIIK